MNSSINTHFGSYQEYVNQIVLYYFTNQDQTIFLEKSGILLHEGQQNDKLFFVKQGKLKGYWLNENSQEIESFEAIEGSFIGIPSFFSDIHISLHTVTAIEDSVLQYITLSPELLQLNDTNSLEEQFMPLVINELIHRQLHVQRLAKEKVKTQQILAQHEKMAALGTVSAGIAHELNNAIAVIQHSNEWLAKTIKNILIQENQHNLESFTNGLTNGRSLSNKEIRELAQTLSQQYRIDQDTAEKMAPLQVSGKQIKYFSKNPKQLDVLHHFWELGATLKDMQTAAEMAAHVVHSVKALGSRSTKIQIGMDINETIDKAVTLLNSSLRLIQFQKDLQPLPPVTCAVGEMIQVWVNLIQNALDSMFADTVDNPTITISSKMVGEFIQVQVMDNGNGIPDNIIDKIFTPQFTTKSGETTVGLGLGLTIVNKIVESHQGNICVESKPGKTVFTVSLPVGGHHE